MTILGFLKVDKKTYIYYRGYLTPSTMYKRGNWSMSFNSQLINISDMMLDMTQGEAFKAFIQKIEKAKKAFSCVNWGIINFEDF